MTKALLTIFAVCTLTISHGQTTEFRVALNSGLFSFAGKSAEATSSINYSEVSKSGYTNNPYGSNSALCVGVSGNLKRVSKRNFIVGVDLGYELLRSKILIDRVNSATGGAAATGQTFLKYDFVNLHPFLGYRLAVNAVKLDFTGGFDFGYCLAAKEKGRATDVNNATYTTSTERKTMAIDIRPRIQISADYNKVGAYVGYSVGLINYKSGYDGGTNDCYARLLRFGLTYRIAG